MAETRKSSEDRQVELVDAALQLIATRGIAALSTRSLAEAVGLSSGAIFKHFPSLDALFQALVARVEGVLDSTYPPPGLPPLERLQAFIQARSQAAGGQLGLHRLVTSEQFHLALPEAGAERLGKAVQRSRAFIVECLREGQASGAVRDDIPVPALVPIVMGTVQALALASGAPSHRGLDVEGTIAALVTLPSPPLLSPPCSPPPQRKRSK